VAGLLSDLCCKAQGAKRLFCACAERLHRKKHREKKGAGTLTSTKGAPIPSASLNKIFILSERESNKSPFYFLARAFRQNNKFCVMAGARGGAV
jgi:hypothetical protein